MGRATGPQERVYDVEDYLHQLLDMTSTSEEPVRYQFLGSTFILPQERRFASLENVQSYVDGVLALGAVKATWEKASDPVRIAVSKYDFRGMYSKGVIYMPRSLDYGMRETFVLHELAHHLSGSNGHSDKFRECYCDLVGTVVSEELAWMMNILFENGLEITRNGG